MRNSRKMILLGVFFSLIIIGSLNSNNLVRGQEYSYSLLLVPDVTYEWDVTTLSIVGDPFDDFLDYGDETISQGDKLSAEILLDVNETMVGDPTQVFNLSLVWVEFFLNGDNKSTSVLDIGVFDLYWVRLGNYNFLEPNVYTNSTGVYDNFLIYHNKYPEVTADSRVETSEYAYYELEIEKIATASKLSKDTWSIKIDYSLDVNIEDLRDPNDWEKRHTVESLKAELRFNRETGLLAYLQYTSNIHEISEIDGSIDDDIDGVDLLIESTLLPTSAAFEWSFAVAGLVIFSIVIIRRKRK